MMNLSVDLCGQELRNPTILASGILGSSPDILERVAKNGAGAVITKSIGPIRREGYKNPTVIEPMENVILNAMGLPNPGYKEFIKEIDDYLNILGADGVDSVSVPLIVSIFGAVPEIADVACAIADSGVKILEINISCPQAFARCIKPGLVGQDKEATREVVHAVKDAVKIPIIVKLSPNVTDITEIAKAAVDAGADAISAINTIQALEVEPMVEKPVLGNIFGGQSGPSVRCIAQKKIADITLAMELGEIRKVPVIGIGGVRSGLDIARFILLGASCVQIGSSVLYDDIGIFKKSVDELKEFMNEKGYKKLSDFRGNALKWLPRE